jgi:TolA-binding protein
MARRLPHLTAFLVLLALTLPTPPARALDEPERLRLVGERAFADGLYVVSRRALERLVAEYPSDGKLSATLLLLGRARLALGDAESALEAFRRLDKLGTPPLELKFWEGESLFRLRRFAEARAAYEALARKDLASPNAPDALYGIGLTELELRRPDAAVVAFREVLSGWPDSPLAPGATFYLARTLVELKRFGDALPILTAFPAKYPGHRLAPDTQYLLGLARVSSGDTGGVDDLKAFVLAAPNHAMAPAARRMITTTLARYGNRTQLQSTYAQLLAQQPATAEALYDAGSIAGRIGDQKGQDTAWRRLRKEFPGDPLALQAALELANAAFKRKDWKEASAQAQAAAQSDDEALRVDALLLHGESELKLARWSTAVKAFERVGTTKSVEAAARYRALAGLGLAQEQLKDSRAALAAYEQVAAKSPDATLRDWARDRATALRARLPKPPPPKADGSRTNGKAGGS